MAAVALRVGCSEERGNFVLEPVVCTFRRSFRVHVSPLACLDADPMTPPPAPDDGRKFLKQFPTSGRYRRMLAHAEMESRDWQAADKVGETVS